jgi:hypothetical protein
MLLDAYLLTTEALNNQRPDNTRMSSRLLQLWIEILKFIYWIYNAEIEYKTRVVIELLVIALKSSA